MLFGLGSYWTTLPWRRFWSFCVSTQPTAQQVCMCVCVFVQALCLARGCPSPLSVVSNLTESRTLRTKSPIVLSNNPLNSIASDCIRPVPCCLQLTIGAVSEPRGQGGAVACATASFGPSCGGEQRVSVLLEILVIPSCTCKNLVCGNEKTKKDL